MKSKSTTTSKPIYSGQIEGAANNISASYGTQAPKITAITDALGGLAPDLIKQFQQGDPNITAARDYNTKVLAGDYLTNNPYIDQIVSQTNDSTRNGLAASLGTRGLTGGSAFADIISRGLAQNESNIRYQNYNTERGRQDTAAGMAPSLAAAQYLPLGIVESLAQAQQMPVQAATGAGAGIGGLLGSYTTTQQKSSPSIGMLLAQMAGNAASAYASGGI
jgi:hypothetical protein